MKRNNKSRHFAVGILAVVALAIGAWFGLQSRVSVPPATLADIELPDIDKKLRNGNEWLGKVVVVNHWATWCPPCREEIPLLVDIQIRMGGQGVQVIGIAHDLVDTTRAFGDQMGINYPSLVAIVGGGELMRRHGNASGGGLPFTAFFDRNGNLAATHLGQLHEKDLIAAIKPLL